MPSHNNTKRICIVYIVSRKTNRPIKKKYYNQRLGNQMF